MQIRPAREVPPTPPQRPAARHPLRLLAAAILLLLAVGYVAWWLTAAAALRDGALAWIEQRRAEGLHLTYAGVARRGFPLRLAVRFADAEAAAPDGGWRWTARQARVSVPVSASVFGPRTLRVGLDGEQTVAVGTGETQRRWRGGAETFAVDVIPDAGGMPPATRLRVRHLTLSGADAGDSLGLVRLDLASRGDPTRAASADVSSFSLDLVADGLRLPVDLATPFGREVTRLALDAQLMGALAPRPWPASLAVWRDAGGVVEASRLIVVQGPLTIDGEGTLALDGQGQPIAAMTARIQGWEPALDRLAAAEAIPRHTAAAAKILLRALARTDGESGPVLVAPLTLQERTLSVGPVPVLRLPRVHWLDAG